MERAVHFEILHNITGEDYKLEAQLLLVFVETMTENMQGLRQAHGEGSSDMWKRSAHAFKGVALNLGAEKLGQLCREAQEKCDAGPQDKAAMLQDIEDEAVRVNTEVQDRLKVCQAS